MDVLTHIKNIYKAMTESNNTYVPTEMSEKERDAILRLDKGYKEFLKSDSKVKTTEKSVEDFVNVIGEMEDSKEKTLDIRNVMTANRRAAMMKYHPETEKESKSKASDREIGD